MAPRTWQFFRAGGFDQVRLSTGADLVALKDLDQKLWVALACPTKGLEFDARTLELLDLDKDGRIRAPELVNACTWVGALLKDVETLPAGADTLSLANLNDSDEARKVLASARVVLQGLGQPEAGTLTVAQATEAVKAFDQLPFNGDGIVPPESVSDQALRQAAQDVVDTQGGEKDRSGKPGFTAPRLEAFFKDADAYVAWLDAGAKDKSAQPFGDDTAAAHAAYLAIKGKMDDFFARCRLAAFDARALTAANRDEKDYLAVTGKDLTLDAGDLKAFPLSRIEAGRALSLTDALNPAWAGAMAELVAKVVRPKLGAKQVTLTEAEWLDLRALFGAHEAWLAAKAGASVEKLGGPRVRALLAAKMKDQLEALLAQEKQQEPIAATLTSVEKLVRCHRDLFRLANNFVSFREFYERRGPAVFQVGTLYLDQRACELCLTVADAGRHGTMASLARTYLAYCDLARPASGEKMSVVAAFTNGDSDNLMVGRNGIFYDRQGRDWDATITKLVDAPISVRQAFWAPYKKVIRFVEEQVAKRANAADAESHERLTGHAKDVEKSAEVGKVTSAGGKKVDIGTVAALGVAVGGITAALGAMLEAFFGLGLWMPLGLVGLLLAISGPSMLIAWLKLRQRNLGPLLDANGWALNAPARINVPFGAALTKLAVLPPGSTRDLSDPFAEKHRPWGFWATLAVLVVTAGGWYLGKLDKYLPLSARSVEVLGEKAPAYVAPAKTEAPAPAPAARGSRRCPRSRRPSLLERLDELDHGCGVEVGEPLLGDLPVLAPGALLDDLDHLGVGLGEGEGELPLAVGAVADLAVPRVDAGGVGPGRGAAAGRRRRGRRRGHRAHRLPAAHLVERGHLRARRASRLAHAVFALGVPHRVRVRRLGAGVPVAARVGLRERRLQEDGGAEDGAGVGQHTAKTGGRRDVHGSSLGERGTAAGRESRRAAHASHDDAGKS